MSFFFRPWDTNQSRSDKVEPPHHPGPSSPRTPTKIIIVIGRDAKFRTQTIKLVRNVKGGSVIKGEQLK